MNRTMKKIFANISVALLIIAYFGGALAGSFSGQINSFLGTSTSKIEYLEGSDGTYPRYYETSYKSVAELKAAGLAKAEEVEAEGAVLLMNNGLLPLKGNKVSLFGATASSPVYGGTGSGAVSTDDAPTYPDALERAGLTVTNKALLDWYKSEEYGREFSSDGAGINEVKWTKIAKSDVADTFGNGEVAIFVVGRVGGEANDLKASNHSDGGQNPLGADVDENSDYLMLNKEELGILKGLKGRTKARFPASLCCSIALTPFLLSSCLTRPTALTPLCGLVPLVRPVFTLWAIC